MAGRRAAHAAGRAEVSDQDGRPADGVDPIIERPIEHAYALVPDPKRRGRFFAVHLTNVIAGGYEHLEPSGRSDVIPWGLRRMQRAMDERSARKQWGEAGTDLPKVEP